MRAQLEQDFERFKRGLPREFAAHVRAAYRIDLTGRYAGEPLPHPIGKGSGQLSLNAGQLEEDAAAGLAFVVLKTVIAEDETGAQAMAAWAIHETRMRVERRAASDGRPGWTVTWKGRGWDRTLDEYLALVRAGRDVTRAGGPLVVPSVKYHLPRLDEPFRDAEYRHTTGRLAQAWGAPPLLVEKDFSPTLAGDALADDRAQILRWLREVPGRIRAASPLVLGTLLTPGASPGFPALVGTGNICSGRLILDYARRGCESVELHSFFQLPLSQYPATHGSRTQRALHALLFAPEDGLIAGMLALAAHGELERRDGELHFLDLRAHAHRPG